MYYAKHEHATFLIVSTRLSSEKRDQIKKIAFQHTQQFLDCVKTSSKQYRIFEIFRFRY